MSTKDPKALDIHYDCDKRALFGVLRRRMTTEEFHEINRFVTQSSEFPSDVRTLWDLREVDFAEVEQKYQESLIDIRKQYPSRGAARIAFIVADELGFGLLRMYGILSSDLPQQIQVFQDYSEGEAWLLSQD
jgi:hypothetical protein